MVWGEGMMGMARCFLQAGSRSVVATLWKVDDQATSDLVTEFLKRDAAGKPAAQALKEARDTVRAQDVRCGPWRYRRSHPLFWAPFVIYGDPGGN